MSALTIYPECAVGNHARTLVEHVERPATADDQWPGLPAVDVVADMQIRERVGCARMACTCPCHLMTVAWGADGLASNSYHHSLSFAAQVIQREIAGYLEEDA